MDKKKKSTRAELRGKWFLKGQNSILRRNKSGCCCIIVNDSFVISPCAAHVEWLEDALKEVDDET